MANHVADHGKSMRQAMPIILKRLKECASQKTTITYGGLVEGTGIIPRNAGRPLTYIHEQVCLPYGRPWLCVLAVRKCKKEPCLPGPGIVGATGVSFEEPGGADLWREKAQDVYAYDWTDVELEGE